MKVKCDIYGYPIYNETMRKYVVTDANGTVFITIDALSESDAETRIQNLFFAMQRERVHVKEVK